MLLPGCDVPQVIRELFRWVLLRSFPEAVNQLVTMSTFGHK
jgi:hypothetical protein